jgi:signal transduction histidine kinase
MTVAILTLMGWLTAAAAAAVWVCSQAAARDRVACACHEVRGPLTAAMLALEGMRRRAEAPPERLAALEEQLRRARLGLEDLVRAPEGDEAVDRLQTVSAGELLTALEVAWWPTAAARGRALRFGYVAAGAVLLADPVRFAQAAGNLIANALEHGRGDIEVRGRMSGGRLRVEVSDQGEGLAAPIVDLMRRPHGARGRGLGIAAAIAERHGGRLTSAPSAAGATLVLELPVLESAPRPALEWTAASAAPHVAELHTREPLQEHGSSLRSETSS